jgi:GcrA cell cycle regulator
MLWTDEEIRELISLWPTNSATQIASRLRRPAAAITGKVKRLRDEGVLPAEVIKHYDVAPAKLKRASAASSDLRHRGANPANAFSTRGEAPCSILDLDDNRCHWPLGAVHEVAALFCGGTTEPGRRYCTHHLRLARGRA